MFKKMIDFLANDVTVSINGADARFEGVKFAFLLPGFICVSTDEEPIVLSVGEVYEGQTASKRIDLLPLKDHYSKDETLAFQSYLKFALSKNSNVVVKPRVFLNNGGHPFSSAQKKFLEEVFQASQAREVLFWNGVNRKYD